jgi:hypothetical protein
LYQIWTSTGENETGLSLQKYRLKTLVNSTTGQTETVNLITPETEIAFMATANTQSELAKYTQFDYRLFDYEAKRKDYRMNW